MTERDAKGRFAKKEVVPAEPITLSDGALAVLRSLPEVCAVAGPGESIDVAMAEEGHYLVRFWPLLTQEPSYKSWQLGPALIFDIDTTSKPDVRGGSNSQEARKAGNHFSWPVRMRMGEAGEFKGRGYFRYAYDIDSFAFNGEKEHRYRGQEWMRDGAVCRGDASFSNNPFQAILGLRPWIVQTIQGVYTSGSLDVAQQWWKGEQGQRFLFDNPLPRCIVVPWKPGDVAKVEVLSAALVEKAQAGEWKGVPAQIAAAAEGVPSA